MARSFRELWEAMPAERQAEVRRRTQQLLAEMPMQQQREVRGPAGKAVADVTFPDGQEEIQRGKVGRTGARGG